MAARAIADTGFLVALFDGWDDQHEWANGIAARFRGPWLTAEACISECLFLFERSGTQTRDALFTALEQGLIISRHLLPEELKPVQHELTKYRDRWVDFADACIVRLSDVNSRLPVITTDVRDFTVYFRQRAGRTLILPSAKAKRVKKPKRA